MSVEKTLEAGTDWYSLMKTEIDAKRPSGVYYTDHKGNGHAVVIDEYTVMDSKTYFQINLGWFGNSEGWYSLAEDLPKHTKEILVITIVPQNAEGQVDGGGEKS